jgi:hypothetical protein
VDENVSAPHMRFLIDHDTRPSSKFLAAHAKAEIFSSARISDTIEVCFFLYRWS